MQNLQYKAPRVCTAFYKITGDITDTIGPFKGWWSVLCTAFNVADQCLVPIDIQGQCAPLRRICPRYVPLLCFLVFVAAPSLLINVPHFHWWPVGAVLLKEPGMRSLSCLGMKRIWRIGSRGGGVGSKDVNTSCICICDHCDRPLQHLQGTEPLCLLSVMQE